MKNLALHEVRLILAKIIWSFNMELALESERWNVQKCVVLWSKGHFLVRMVTSQVGRDMVSAGTAAW